MCVCEIQMSVLDIFLKFLFKKDFLKNDIWHNRGPESLDALLKVSRVDNVTTWGRPHIFWFSVQYISFILRYLVICKLLQLELPSIKKSLS